MRQKNIQIGDIVEYSYKGDRVELNRILLRVVDIQRINHYICDGYTKNGLMYENVFFRLYGNCTIMPFSSWAVAVMKGYYESSSIG